MSRYLALFLMIGLLLVSCGTSRFTFDRTEKTITELGGTYNKEVGEELEKVYKNGDIDDVIEMVYQSDYTGGDPYVVVEGYLGEEPFEEFKKRVKEIKKEIENLWKGVDLEKDQIGGNEGLALAVLDETYPEGLVIEALGGLDNKNTQDFKNLLDQKYALRDELRGILSQSGIEGIKEAIVNEEYTEEEIEAYLGKSTLDDAKLALAKETGTDGFVPVAKKSGDTGEMEFVAKKDSAKTNTAENEEMVRFIAEKLIERKYINSIERFDYILKLVDNVLLDKENDKYFNQQVNNHLYELRTFNEADLFENGIVKEHIHIMTIHKAKGLQFDNVIVCDVSEGSFPVYWSKNKSEDARTLYVALSRAKKRLYITYVAAPSEFMQSINKCFELMDRNAMKELLRMEESYKKAGDVEV